MAAMIAVLWLVIFGKTTWDFTSIPVFGQHMQAIATQFQMRRYWAHLSQVYVAWDWMYSFARSQDFHTSLETLKSIAPSSASSTMEVLGGYAPVGAGALVLAMGNVLRSTRNSLC